MAAFNAYKTAQGWIITATVNGKDRYLQKISKGEYIFHRDPTYAKCVSDSTASKYLTDLLGIPFQITVRSEGKMNRIIREMMKKGWDKDEAFLIADRIFRQYESNVMGLSVLAMVKQQPTKSECI